MGSWTEQVAFVTGTSSGIGEAIAERLVEEGLKVVGVARRIARLEQLATKLSSKKGKFYPIQCDVTQEEDILKALEWTKENVGPVNIVVNNAGINLMENISECPTTTWRQLLDVNVLSLCIVTREAIKQMKENNIAGHIVNMNSIAGHKVDKCPKLNLYPACKHAVTALTETLRLELATQESKIRVTSISPGMVESEMTTNFFNEVEFSEEDLEALKSCAILESSVVADAIWYALSRPKHVNITEMVIQPVGELF